MQSAVREIDLDAHACSTPAAAAAVLLMCDAMQCTRSCTAGRSAHNRAYPTNPPPPLAANTNPQHGTTQRPALLTRSKHTKTGHTRMHTRHTSSTAPKEQYRGAAARDVPCVATPHQTPLKPTTTEAQASRPCRCLCSSQRLQQLWEPHRLARQLLVWLLLLLSLSCGTRCPCYSKRTHWWWAIEPTNPFLTPVPAAPAPCYTRLACRCPLQLAKMLHCAAAPHMLCPAADTPALPCCAAAGPAVRAHAHALVEGAAVYMALAGCRCEVSCLRYLLLLMLLTTGSATGAR